MHRHRAALLTACDEDECAFPQIHFFSTLAHVTACVCLLWGACVQEHGVGACRHAGMQACACVRAVYAEYGAPISVCILLRKVMWGPSLPQVKTEQSS